MLKDKKIRVCHIASIDMTIRFLLLGQLKFLKDQGYEVFAVCSPGKLLGPVEKEGIKIKTIRFKRKISPFFDLVTLLKLFFYFKKEKFQIVHTHSPKPGLLGQMAAKMAGVPIVVNTVHGFYFHEGSSAFERKFFILMEKIAAKYSDLILSQNREDIKTAVKEKICSPLKIEYLGNGINLQRFDPARFSEEFIGRKKKELNIEPDHKIIGIVGRLVKEKGYFDLFEAFKIILRQFPQSQLLSIGPIEPEKKDAFSPDIIKEFGIEKNVIFLGQRTDIEELYLLMDIFVLPSWREGFPRTLIEAQAMAKPVIATDIRGCRECVEPGLTGVLVPPGNPQKLAEAIIYLLRNPEKAKKMGERGKARAERNFDERQVFDRIKREYERLIREKL